MRYRSSEATDHCKEQTRNLLLVETRSSKREKKNQTLISICVANSQYVRYWTFCQWGMAGISLNFAIRQGARIKFSIAQVRPYICDLPKCGAKRTFICLVNEEVALPQQERRKRVIAGRQMLSPQKFNTFRNEWCCLAANATTKSKDKKSVFFFLEQTFYFGTHARSTRKKSVPVVSVESGPRMEGRLVISARRTHSQESFLLFPTLAFLLQHSLGPHSG